MKKAKIVTVLVASGLLSCMLIACESGSDPDSPPPGATKVDPEREPRPAPQGPAPSQGG